MHTSKLGALFCRSLVLLPKFFVEIQTLRGILCALLLDRLPHSKNQGAQVPNDTTAPRSEDYDIL